MLLVVVGSLYSYCFFCAIYFDFTIFVLFKTTLSKRQKPNFTKSKTWHPIYVLRTAEMVFGMGNKDEPKISGTYLQQIRRVSLRGRVAAPSAGSLVSCLLKLYRTNVLRACVCERCHSSLFEPPSSTSRPAGPPFGISGAPFGSWVHANYTPCKHSY